MRFPPGHDFPVKPCTDHGGDKACGFPQWRGTVAPVGPRKPEEHDGLAALVKNELHKDPFTGTVFVRHCARTGGSCASLRSKRADRLKLLYWDGTRLVMAYKRLEAHGFVWPQIQDGLMVLNHAQFEALFSGLDWRRVRAVSIRVPEAV